MSNAMTVHELYNALEAILPRSLSCDWDNDGISCCPDPNAPVKGILIALDPTEDALNAAIEGGCNVILTHHPMLFRGLKTVDGHDTGSRKVIRMIGAGITAMSFHTRLDAADGGVNDLLAARLGLQDVEPFGDDGNPAGKPIGRVGNLPHAVSADAFIEAVKNALDLPALVFAGCGKPVRRVAVLGGAGEDDIAAAVAAGADTYVTGELKYHQLCDAPYGEINLIMAGHYHTEAPVLDYLATLCDEVCPEVTVCVLNSTRVEVR
ncbi:MAG: Nif3-like dinuclear metal center hexameric protein [Clostridia bacterium]|nr:Nif3-like dinuclear metal center hexameric protein [Clostridia bacterium]